MASELRVNTLKDAAGNNSIATSFVSGTMFAKSCVGVPGLDVGNVKTCLSAVPPKSALPASPASSPIVGALEAILPV